MFLDLRDLALRGGDRYERSFPLDIAPLVLGGAQYEVLIPRGVTVSVDRVAGGFLVDVSLASKIYGPCARCLCEAAVGIEARQEEFVPTAKDGWEGSDLSAFVQEMVVDVAGIAREALVLSLPVQIVCSPPCRGLCPQCGQDLNVRDCDCVAAQGDARWDKLKDIRREA